MEKWEFESFRAQLNHNRLGSGFRGMIFKISFRLFRSWELTFLNFGKKWAIQVYTSLSMYMVRMDLFRWGGFLLPTLLATEICPWAFDHSVSFTTLLSKPWVDAPSVTILWWHVCTNSFEKSLCRIPRRGFFDYTFDLFWKSVIAYHFIPDVKRLN